ncbi:Scr1 family TA system antitoxin-like transcriptional regulator [Streptomyces sp. 8N616]|uniref:Scr1 family TA system antitoxin-like transcriptional regulator n=1 Tax=Streptomyces sp. 8N616 TaxID=3457414 RepID=UPI003FD2DBEA
MIDKADEVLSAGEVLRAMKDAVARARYPGFFRDAARLEADAVELRVYASQATPGLLQTEEYARAVFAMWRPLLDEDTSSSRAGGVHVRDSKDMARVQYSRSPLKSGQHS